MSPHPFDDIQSWRPAMVRFARLHLQPQEEAEDAVQDALLAALSGSHRADQIQDVRHYLFGILRNKVTDRLRQRYRHGQPREAPEDDALDDVLFDPRGHWAVGQSPQRWDTPDRLLGSEQFFAVVDLCITKLPSKSARVFSMKELLELDAEEVCSTLAISKDDYWQCMSRARKQLQLCLDQRWFMETHT